MRENELILFESQDKTVVLPVQMKDESVWLTQSTNGRIIFNN